MHYTRIAGGAAVVVADRTREIGSSAFGALPMEMRDYLTMITEPDGGRLIPT